MAVDQARAEAAMRQYTRDLQLAMITFREAMGDATARFQRAMLGEDTEPLGNQLEKLRANAEQVLSQMEERTQQIMAQDEEQARKIITGDVRNTTGVASEWGEPNWET